MSTNAKQVSVGKPMVGGAVHVAPQGTSLPIKATSKLNDAFEDLGYISEDGVTNANERETDEIKAWGGDVVLTPQTGKNDTFNLTFIEALNPTVLKAVYGEENVTGDLSEGIRVVSNAKELPYGSWVIDMVLTEGALKRVVIPNGKITEVDEISYTDSDAIGYPVTIQAFPDAAGNTHYEYIQGNGSEEPTENTEEGA